MTQVANNPQIIIEEGLIKIHENNAALVFSSEDSIRNIVGLIRREVCGHEPDLTTVKGRKAIASLAMQVSKSKVILDDLGKGLVSEWKAKAKVVDQARKVARDELDALRDETRQPLTEWEEQQDRIAVEEQLAREAEAAAKQLAEEIERCHGEALLEDEVQTLRREKADRDRAEQERLRKEQEEKERAEREELIRQQERDKVEREAAERQRKAQEESDRKVREAKEAADREIQKEKDRLAQIERDRVEAEVRERKQREAEQAEAERKANLKRNIAAKNNQAMKSIIKVLDQNTNSQFGEDLNQTAKALVEAIARGQITNVTINY